MPVVQCVRIRPRRDQELRDVDAVMGSGEQQRRTPVRVPCLQVGAGAQGGGHGIPVTTLGSGQELPVEVVGRHAGKTRRLGTEPT